MEKGIKGKCEDCKHMLKGENQLKCSLSGFTVYETYYCRNFEPKIG